MCLTHKTPETQVRLDMAKCSGQRSSFLSSWFSVSIIDWCPFKKNVVILLSVILPYTSCLCSFSWPDVCCSAQAESEREPTALNLARTNQSQLKYSQKWARTALAASMVPWIFISLNYMSSRQSKHNDLSRHKCEMKPSLVVVNAKRLFSVIG